MVNKTAKATKKTTAKAKEKKTVEAPEKPPDKKEEKVLELQSYVATIDGVEYNFGCPSNTIPTVNVVGEPPQYNMYGSDPGLGAAGTASKTDYIKSADKYKNIPHTLHFLKKKDKIGSQKARGVLAITQHWNDADNKLAKDARIWHGDKVAAEEFFAAIAAKHVAAYGPVSWEQGVFARPCPKRPRHGFVDSRVVNSVDELMKLADEIRAVNEDVEVLLMPKVDASLSGILSDGVLAIGSGNDGATSGKDGIAIPVPFTFKDKAYAKLMEAADISDKGSPYMEWVAHGSSILPVQIREGPKALATSDFVPKDMTVKDVIVADTSDESTGALIAWEKKIEALDPDSGVVVFVKGGTLLSHYAVHAVQRGVPVVSGAMPKVGDFLPKSAPRTYNHAILRAYLADEIFNVSRVNRMKGENRYIDLSAAGLHLQPYWGAGMESLVSKILACTLTGACAAVLGERRYGDGHVPAKLTGARNTVYTASYKLPWPEVSKLVREAKHAFLTLPWGGAYGGKKWANCSSATFKLAHAIARYLKSSTQEDGVKLWGEIVKRWNRVINVSHNGGLFLNKFGLPFADSANNPHKVLTQWKGWNFKELAAPPKPLKLDGAVMGALLEMAVPYDPGDDGSGKAAKKKYQEEMAEYKKSLSEYEKLVAEKKTLSKDDVIKGMKFRVQWRDIKESGDTTHIRVQARENTTNKHYEGTFGCSGKAVPKITAKDKTSPSDAGTDAKYKVIAEKADWESTKGSIVAEFKEASKEILEMLGMWAESVAKMKIASNGMPMPPTKPSMKTNGFSYYAGALKANDGDDETDIFDPTVDEDADDGTIGYDETDEEEDETNEKAA